MDFKSRYKRECLLKGTYPLHVIEAGLVDSTLRFNFLRIPPSEWNPILSTLTSTSTVKKICVTIDVDFVINHKIHQQKLKHLNSFMENLSVHLGNNQILTHLELVGLPFSYADIEHLTKGIDNSNTLQYICLAKSKIGDEGLIIMIEAIKRKPNIVWLDLRNCGLTCRVGKPLASLVQFQALARENAARKASLIEEIPNLHLMGGLRRLSLSGNHLCDAVRHLAVALYEDRWINAIDLQFCNLENTHLDQLIRAAEKNQSLIFLDISNNNDLNSELLNKLKEVLSFNSLKHHPAVLESIKLPKHISNLLLVNQAKEKYLDYQVTTSKEVNPILAKTRNKVISRNKAKLSEDKESTKIADPMIDLSKERKLRSDAEEQVIKMCSEMELARTRITKLEEEVKLLGAKQKKLPNKSMLRPDHSKVVLKELKLTSAVSRCSDAKDPSQEIQGILDSVYATVREFAPKVNRLILESHGPLNFNNSSNKKAEISYCTVPRNGNGKQPSQYCSTKSASSLFSSDQNPKKKDKYCENLFEVLDKNRLGESVSTTSSRIQTSAMVKDDVSNKSSQTTNSRNFASPKSPPVFDAPQKSQQSDASCVIPQDSSRTDTNNFCVNSLKSLQSGLEELLQELSEKINDAPSDKINSKSQLTITGNLADLTNQEEESHYSTDFDSFRSSIKSISNYSSQSNVENRRPSSSKSKKLRHLGLQQHKPFSSSSSSIDLSSIVDLLGNFSVEDIGSGTLTPP